MNLLAAKLYDPAVAVSKATTAALAMTALDTTNLRLAITVPAHGMVRFRLAGTLHGATTMPQIMLGVMNGSTVLGRISPMHGPTNIAATSLVKVEADFIVTDLTPGAMNVDAAYGVETTVASTGLKYGGPNNTTANDAFGGFVFEAWDPQPQSPNTILAVDANGRVDVGKVAGTAQTAGDIIADTNDIQSRLPATLVSGRMDASVGAMANNVLTAAAINAGALNGKGDWALAADWTAARAAKVDNLDATVSSRLAAAAYTAPPTVAAIRAEVDANSTALAAIFARTDVATSTRAVAGDAMTLTAGERGSVADKLLGRNLAGAVDGGRTMADAMRALRNKTALAAGVLTVYQEDDVTPAWTAAVTTAARDPLESVDPA